jgi:hypothetical protein
MFLPVIFGITNDGKLWYTRPVDADITSWNPWAALNTHEPFVSIGSALSADDKGNTFLHLCGITHDGKLWYTLRSDSDTTWQPFEDLGARVGGHAVQSVALTGLLDLSLCVLVQRDHNQQHILQSTRHNDGTWDAFTDITGPQLAGFPGSFTRISCSVVRPKPQATTLDVCGITADGRLWYTSHLTLPLWLPFINVQAGATDAPAHCAEVSTVGNGGLSVFVQSGGAIWHTSRSGYPDFQWQPAFDNIESQAGNPGPFGSISGSNANGPLHLCGITHDGRLWHSQTSPTSPYGWLPFEDLTSKIGKPGSFKTVCLAGIDVITEFSGTNPQCAQIQTNIASDESTIMRLQQQASWNPSARAEISSLRQAIASLEAQAASLGC